MVEAQPAVVDAVQAALDAVVLAADTGQEHPVVVAQRDVERVHAVVDPAVTSFANTTAAWPCRAALPM